MNQLDINTEHDLTDMIKLLMECDDKYHNGEESPLIDSQYDILYKKAKEMQPHHIYFTGIGSDVRGGKISLPYELGSLNQKFDDDVNNWITTYDFNAEHFVLTDKLDGISAMLIYPANNEPLQIAYSRGNGTEGADITRHVSQIAPTHIDTTESLVVRGEIIISKTNFKKLQSKIKTRARQEYKNARNLVAGLMNASENDTIVYDYIDFIAYEIIGIETSKVEMLETLLDAGFQVPIWADLIGSDLTNTKLDAYVKNRKKESLYEIDGVVVDLNNEDIRLQLNADNSGPNPEYAFKYKIKCDDNYAITTVAKVELRTSKHGYIKPRIHINPVELVGVTVKHATGFNMKFISDNYIRPGTKVAISRQGDVIPHIVDILGQSDEMSHMEYQIWLTKQLDLHGNWEWTETEVDVVLINAEDNKTVLIKQLIDMFDKLNVAYLGSGNITKLFEVGYISPEEIIMASKVELSAILGANGAKVYDSIHEKLTNIPYYKLAGAYSIQRGIGVRKLKKLEYALGDDYILKPSVNSFERVNGFDTKTAKKAVLAIEDFNEFLLCVSDVVTIKCDDIKETKLLDMKICFTGFRDSNLQQVIESYGGTIQSTVSKNTNIVVTTDPNGTSSKLKKARQLSIRIINPDEMRAMLK